MGLCEAMASGCAVIATEYNDSVFDIIEPGRNGIVVPCDDEAALAAFREQLGERYVSVEPMVLETYSSDASHHSGGIAGAVLFPRTTQHVSDALKLCSKFGIQVTACLCDELFSFLVVSRMGNVFEGCHRGQMLH